jgi:pSer/pThr/pTyr-binding forkhead associated (FHA) protein
MTIGRHRSCTLVIEDQTVSRRHAAIQRRGDEWVIEDLGSKNGTRVNGVPVTGEVVIEPGDVLGFGASVLRFAPGGRRLFAAPREAEPAAQAA